MTRDDDLADEADVESVDSNPKPRAKATKASKATKGARVRPEPRVEPEPRVSSPPKSRSWLRWLVVVASLIVAVYEWNEATEATSKMRHFEDEADEESARADEAEERLAACRNERPSPRKPRTPHR